MLETLAKRLDLAKVYQNYERTKRELLTRVVFEVEDSGKPINFLIDTERAEVFYSTEDYTGRVLEYLLLYRFDSSSINRLPVRFFFSEKENYTTLAAAEGARRDMTFPEWISRRTGKSYYQARREAIKRFISEEIDKAFFQVWKM